MPPTQETTRPCACSFNSLRVIKQIFGHGQPVGEGLARAGLRRNQEVAVGGFVREHGELNGGRTVVVALGQSSGERRTHGRKRHGINLGWSRRGTSSRAT